MINLVIFDCDGVLIDSEVISARMLIGALADHGVSVDMVYVVEHFLGRSYPTVLEHVRTEFGIDLPTSFEDDYRQRLLDPFARELKVMPDVRAVIEALGVPYALATSSSPRRLAMSLDLTGLADQFAEGCSPPRKSHAASTRPACSSMWRRRWALRPRTVW